ncbi:MAG: DNA replication/repair protein RecF [Gammaproteobacteria bacterium]
MSVEKLRIEQFRCLQSVDIEADARQNVILGPNGAGKTSVLEALFFLGRGRSFRPGHSANLIQTGAGNFTLYAELRSAAGRHRLGVQLSRADGLEVHIDGEGGGARADLVSAFPVQVIDPEVHEMVQGGPKGRRRFLDWGVFHVKHDFFPVWRRYRKALQQRNRALRQGMARDTVAAWNTELIASGIEIDGLRRTYLEGLIPHLEDLSTTLLGLPASCRYKRGWSAEIDYAEALEASWQRDADHGQTHVGPHRAELALEVDEVAARNRLSRGQQKLLGISLLLAQTQFVAERLDRDVTLLVDEPAAELDNERLERLMSVLASSRAQLFISALDREALPLDAPARVFHVERGQLTTLL